MAKAIDWVQAVALQDELATMSREPLAESEKPNGRKSMLSKIGEDTALADHRLRQYWSDVLVSSVLGDGKLGSQYGTNRGK